MADNVQITEGVGTAVHADEYTHGTFGAGKSQVIKVTWGPPGTGNDVDTGSGKPLPIQVRSSGGTEVTFNANGQAAMASSAPVTISSDQAAPTSGGYSIFRSLDLDETEEEVKATAGVLYKLRLTNFATSVRYVKLYNATAANTTVGTTTPIDTIPVPAGSATVPTVITEAYGIHGANFATALCLAATTGLADNDTGAPSANDVVATAYYK